MDRLDPYTCLLDLLRAPVEELTACRRQLADSLMDESGSRFDRRGVFSPSIHRLASITKSHRDYAFGTFFVREDFVDDPEEPTSDGRDRMELFLSGWKAAQYAEDSMIEKGWEHINERDYSELDDAAELDDE